MFMKIPKPLLLFIGSFLFSSFIQATPLCIVSLLYETQLNNELPKQVKQHLSQMGHEFSPQNPPFKFYGNLVGLSEVYSSLRNCLEGDYEEAVIIAHSTKNIIGQPVLLFARQRIGNKVSVASVKDQFFASLNDNSKMKQISVIGCNSEQVLTHYPNLLKYISEQNIQLKQGPVDVLLSDMKEVERGRSFEDTVLLLGEAAQPVESQTIFCYVHFQTSNLYSCLRGHLQIEALTIENQQLSRWIQFN